ncbi:NAD(P)H-hydrate dehydratase [Candidatus Woesearchaeota archaeon]|nr:NAD(P)H-hydrate dehydratase [Candidatus Woesearchaeota archaeon]MBW3018158.1 NAD(P)H-hydrate dehydratase [Candidatus Woesearchaeota archaeon]
MAIRFKWVKDEKKKEEKSQHPKLKEFVDEISGKKQSDSKNRVEEFLREKGELNEEKAETKTRTEKKKEKAAKIKVKKEKSKKGRKTKKAVEEDLEEAEPEEEIEEKELKEAKVPAKKERIPVRRKDSHKGDNGKVLVIGGCEFYVGAPGLAAMAALRTGVDLVYVSTIKEAAYVINSYEPSLITQKLDGKCLAEKHYDKIKELIDKVDVIVIGNGIGLDKSTKNLVRKIVKLDIPKVIDGDALDLIKGAEVKNAVLTPHQGEFKELFGTSATKEAMMVYSKPDKIVLLKGRIDYISDGHKLFKNKTGNPGMTVAGTGDVLAGIVGALIALGYGLFDAARIGAHISGDTGDHVRKDLGYCFTAMDIVNNLPHGAKRFVK